MASDQGNDRSSSRVFAKRLKYQLPELYHRLVPLEVLNFRIEETKATCGNCAMSRENRGARARKIYEKDLKCCTFDPILPNYLVGAILNDPRSGEWAHQSLRTKMQNPEECLPLGLRPSTRLQREFLKHKDEDFGRREDWLCPYYDRLHANCGIWRNRGAVCTSFFCFSDAGSAGLAFWSSFERYLHLLEMTLMEEALVHLDFSPRQISELLVYIDPREHSRRRSLPKIESREGKRLWNSYDDPEDFFRRCHQFVSSLKRRDVEIALGSAGEIETENLLKKMRRLE